MRTEPNVRFVLPVIRKQHTSRHSECDCSSAGYCVSNGISVEPSCGCGEFSQQIGFSFCYVVGACPGTNPSTIFAGALWRVCQDTSPPAPGRLECDDPLGALQWHLSHIHAMDAWAMSRGIGSRIVIVDDGIQYDHPDLNVNHEFSFGWDHGTGERTPDADNPHSKHGTASAGVAAAVANNGVGGCGVAPHSALAAVKILRDETETDSFVTDDMFVETLLSFHDTEQTILSNSWGPPDDGRVDGPGIHAWYARVDEVLHHFGTAGRGGKGGIVVFAAGNGGPYDNANDDGFAAHPFTIAVGAIGDTGRRVSYSEPGACIDVVAPSNGGWRSITTTDLIGFGGYTELNSTHDFGGTSAATPMVAATIALMLSVRPSLTLRDVRRILHTTASQTDPSGEDWVVNAAGRAFNPWYGFGMVDTNAAILLSADWNPLADAREACAASWIGRLPLPSGDWVSVALPALGVDFDFVDEVRVYADIAHPRRGDVLLGVESPLGTTSQLTFAVPQDVEMYDVEFVNRSFLTHAFLGEAGPSEGWMLRIRDISRQGHLLQARICVKGDHLPNPPAPPSVPPQLAQALGGTDWTRIIMWSSVGSAFLCGVLVVACERNRRRPLP